MAGDHCAWDAAIGDRADGPIMATNPMMVPVVLDTLFRVCELDDLRRFRLVCALWCKHSLTRWRKSMVVCITETDWIMPKGHLGIREAVAILLKPEVKNSPFRNFKVNLYTYDILHPRRNLGPTFQEYELFWISLGPFMHSLNLDISRILAGWRLSPWLLEKLPNLEYLELKVRNADNFIAVEGQVQTRLTGISLCVLDADWSIVFETFPNLVNVTIPSHDAENIRNIVSAVKTKAKRDFKLYFRSDFDLSDEIMDQLFELHKNPRLKICEAGFHDWQCNTVPPPIMRTFHQLAGTSLNTLRLRDLSPDYRYLSGMVLKGKWLQLDTLSINCRRIETLDFVRDVPNLRSLSLESLSHDQIAATIIDDTTIGAIKNLQTLAIRLNDLGNLRDSDIVILALLAPSVIDLKASLDNMSFRATCELWKDMRHMMVIGKGKGRAELDDEGITGIVDGSIPTLPNIRDLSCLYSFWTTRENVSDKAIREGFLKMEQLRSVGMTLSPKTSDAAFRELFVKYPGRHLKRGETQSLRSLALNYELEKEGERLYKQYRIGEPHFSQMGVLKKYYGCG